MINFNGKIFNKDSFTLPYNNRAFYYGDAVFETLKITNNQIQFLEDHYFRLMASMRMLRMEIPDYFSLDFLQTEIQKLSDNFTSDKARIRLQIFRDSKGLYTPKENKISYLIEITPLNLVPKDSFELDVYKDFQIFGGSLLSNLKTTNRVLNITAAIYAKENNLDDCILLNQYKRVVETSKANIFIVKANEIFTPALSEGCIKGIMRKKAIEFIQKKGMYRLLECEISPFEIQKADAVFITNSIIGIQAVKKYRKKIFNTTIIDLIFEDSNLI